MERSVLERNALSRDSQRDWVKLRLMQKSRKIPLVLAPSPRRVDLVGEVAGHLNRNYGFFDLEEDLMEVFDFTERQSISDTHEVLSSAIRRLKPRINQPILTAIDIGYALGIKRLDLTVGDATTLYVFRRHIGERRSSEDIAGEIFGFSDSYTEAIIRKSVGRLRGKRAHRRTYQIDTRGRWGNRGYEYTEMR